MTNEQAYRLAKLSRKLGWIAEAVVHNRNSKVLDRKLYGALRVRWPGDHGWIWILAHRTWPDVMRTRLGATGGVR